MNVLVVGGAGFIGEALYNYVGPFGRSRSTYYFLSQYTLRYTRESFSNCRLIASDWRNADYKTIISQNNIDTVVLLAWGSHPRSSNNDVFLDFHSNTFYIFNAIESMINAGVRKFIFTSSTAAISTASKSYHLRQKSSYAAGKLIIEILLGLFGEIESCEYEILRIPNLYGPFQDGFSGQGIFPIFSRTIYNKKKPVFIGDYKVNKGYVYIAQLLQIITDYAESERSSNAITIIPPEIVLNAEDVFRIVANSLREAAAVKYSKSLLNRSFDERLSFEENVKITLSWLIYNDLL